jgi:glycerol-3-phosphate dehydrogenase
MMENAFDLLIVGGGINGTGIARDAAGRGLQVCLVEKNDLAGATSSASTKMIHGGLRYLEYYEFGLVRQALKEREKLLAIAPHLISPLRIVLPILPKMRPAWMIRIGLWIYDHLGGKISLPSTTSLRLKNTLEGAPLAPGPTKAFAYSDGWVDDARLVVLNAFDAGARGADIRTQTTAIAMEKQDDHWAVTLQGNGEQSVVLAKCVVNAAGPWADKVDALAGLAHAKHLVKVQGSHIILPKLYEGEHAYLFQNPDRRVLFAIPYQGRFTLFGTTDTPLEGDPGKAHLNEDESQYLLEAVERFFGKSRTADDIVWSYSGVRALFGDPEKNASALSRDYDLEMDPPGETPPFLSVLGGKITTYRSLSEKAVNMVCARIGKEGTSGWTSTIALPGGDLGAGGRAQLLVDIQKKWSFFTLETAQRLAHAYGSLVDTIFENIKTEADLGQNFGHQFYACEAKYLIAHEWAKTPEDILWRRSKLGLHLSKEEIQTFETWFSKNQA